ncbi:MAG TPA: hypothetical protein VGP46_07495 [Acidimicrobiales bacterium]|nr:hypothetical protein [Acidimicrobiales bacterium]
MTLYAQLLTIALEDREADERRPTSELISRVIAQRAFLAETKDRADRVSGALAYDVALARLCERLQIDHELTGEQAGPPARLATERLLLQRLPSLADALKADEP